MAYQFPTFQEIYSAETRKLKIFRQFLRFQFSSIYCRNEIKQFETFLDKHPMWQAMFNDNTFRCNTILHKFCDNRFGKTQRLNVVLDSMVLMEQHFSKSLCQTLINEKQIVLFEQDDIQITLQLNTIEPHEGFFAFRLKYQEQWVYHATIALLKPNILLIPSLQGTNAENAQDLIKIVTKKLHGIRPMYMMIYLGKLFAEHYKFMLLGIAHKNQVKYRFNDSSRLLFNYDAFWQENDAKLNENGYWVLGNSIERKPLEDIQSKKRSMYRKRYEMLDEISLNIKKSD